MYPGMAEEAREEDFEEIADPFEYLMLSHKEGKLKTDFQVEIRPVAENIRQSLIGDLD